MRIATLAIAAIAVLGLAACAAPKLDDDGRAELELRGRTALAEFRRNETVERFFPDAYGYAIFPSVAKGAAGIGGARGTGLVYRGTGSNAELTGSARMSQATIGAQIGGQRYRELILFQDALAYDRFMRSNFAFSAQASAVAADAGASADAAYEAGVMVFTMERGGLMVEASIGGQDFNVERID